MKAETAYNVIQALSEKEKQRLYKMLGVKIKPELIKSKRKSKAQREAEVAEYLDRLFAKRHKKQETELKPMTEKEIDGLKFLEYVKSRPKRKF
ncbi:hypothetical protein [Tenacibaculum sp. SG-28]|uniref:hypothetical protein n=1 Tax=Tenacibaculum sp. SG-28 TaxID=754426 RepID=UPI000CF4FE74|nr:hypothetical protein [Tenacibaculum sp. SG-28]PQJ23365.1 hypothetical protein BSU00_04005 [Tenacibaculum sp. SG-28]